MIRPFVGADAENIADLHLAEMQSDLLGFTGRKLLTCYYRALSNGQGATGFICANDGETISGFVCGVWDGGKLLRTVLLKEWTGLLLWETVHLITHPPALLKAIRRFARTAARSWKRAVAAQHCREYELRPIVVRANARGRGIADALLRKLLEDARSRGFGSVMLISAADNGRANAFYRKSGFMLESTDGGFCRYRLTL